jgi:hypothetical protein
MAPRAAACLACVVCCLVLLVAADSSPRANAKAARVPSKGPRALDDLKLPVASTKFVAEVNESITPLTGAPKPRLGYPIDPVFANIRSRSLLRAPLRWNLICAPRSRHRIVLGNGTRECLKQWSAYVFTRQQRMDFFMKAMHTTAEKIGVWRNTSQTFELVGCVDHGMTAERGHCPARDSGVGIIEHLRYFRQVRGCSCRPSVERSCLLWGMAQRPGARRSPPSSGFSVRSRCSCSSATA